MSYRFNQEWLIKKFEEIKRRTLLALEQLTDEHVNWKPDAASHSIAMLIKHMEGNIQQRIAIGILHKNITIDRTQEFKIITSSRAELEHTIREQFQFIIHTVAELTEEQLEQSQLVRNKVITNLDMLHQCAAHYSEHMGQILYIAKQCRGESYKSTSI